MAGKHGIAKRGTDGQATSPPVVPFCSADDLKGVLASIAGQIADADRRHTATLAAMQERLLLLGREAAAMRSDLPQDLAEDFQRVEAGMARLSERVAAAGQDRPLAEAHAAAPSPEPAVLASAPAPLKSALPPAAAVNGTASPAAPASRPDPFEFAAHSVAADPAEPWDDQSAEALVKLYDSGEAAIAREEPPVEVAPVVPPPARVPVMTLAAEVEGPADRAPSGQPDERAWLEQRFAEIADRVEKSLVGLRPDSAMAALDQRFSEFEHRFDSALDGIATRADVGEIRLIEAHIRELATHVEHAQGQLARLDGIEAQINVLARRLSDDNLAGLLAASAPTHEDIQQVAEAVASRIGPSLTSSTERAGAPGADRVDELRLIIERFVGDQRQGEEHMSSMLDTMQQAMIRMLDRLDSLEQSHPAPARYEPAPAMYQAPSFAPSFAHAPREPDLGAFRAGAEREAIRDEPILPRQGAEVTFNHRPEPPADIAADLGPEPVAAEPPAAAMPADRPSPRSREDFVASARRAMHQAASGSVPPSSEPETIEAPAHEPAPAKRGGAKPVAAKSSGRSKLAGGLQPRLVVGLITILAIGGALAAMNKFRVPSAMPTAKIERRLLTPETEAQDEQSRKAAAPDGAAQGIAAPKAGRSKATGSPAVEPSAESGPKARQRPEPETMIDELSRNDTAPDGEALAAQPARAVSEPLRGITVQQPSRLPTAEELIRAQHQHRLATLSNKIGAAQPVATVSPAALIPNMESAPAAPVGTAAATTADMPPATIGPNSLRLAAANGDPSAEFEVAARFAEGKGVQQDFKQAVSWYNRAATKGFAAAQYRLGTLYERGLGVKADPARAKVWYQRAAEQGNVKSMHNLAVLSAGRDQAAPDYATAARWFQEAADRGLSDSQYNLAILHESGLGVARDPKLAYVWLSLAVKNGDKDAAKRREQVKQSLDAASLKAAGEMVEAWQPKPTDLMANDARAAGEAWKARHAIQPQ